LATAWQESCWRQFVRAGDKIRCLRSYNQTSVGLMQINERVWRGIYSRQKLRWDIAYNAKAGCEILKKYLMRYGLNKMDAQQPEELDLLIKSVYAMYNGGPKQFQRYMERSQRNKLFLSDVLFAQKLAWVEGGVFEKALKCLGGEP
jgi:soluble lytic murein transglycosylase-like protein